MTVCRWQHAHRKKRPMGSISFLQLAQESQKVQLAGSACNLNASITAH